MNKLLLSTAVATAMLLTACGSDKKVSHPTPMPKAPTTTTDSQNQANSAGIGGVGKQDHVPSNSGITGSSGHSGSNASSSGSSGSTSSTGGTNAGGSSSSGGSNASSGSTGGTASGLGSGSTGTTSGSTTTPPTSGSSGGSSSSGSSNSNSGSTGTSSGSNASSGSTGGTASGSGSSGTTSGGTTTPPTGGTTTPPTSGSTGGTNVGGSNANSGSTGGTTSGSGSTGTTSGSTTTPPNSGSSSTGSNAGGSSAGSSSGGSGSTGGTASGATTPPTTTPTIADTKVDTSDWLNRIKHDFSRKKQNVDSYEISINGKASDPKNINFKEFGQGFHKLPYAETIKTTYQDNSKTATHQSEGTLYLFQQAYSAVGGTIMDTTTTTITGNPPQAPKRADIGGNNAFMTGEPVDRNLLPTTGRYTYTGVSHLATGTDFFAAHTWQWKQGDFEYTIDFDTNKGKGRITESDGHVINLQATDFNRDPVNMSGHVETDRIDRQGSYRLGLFGKAAQELVGELSIYGENSEGNKVIISGYFGGKKQ